MSATYPTPARRTALIPGLIAAVALLIGASLVESDSFTIIRYIVSIFALIVAVFAWQGRQWWWLIGLIPIAILWNPVVPIDVAPIELWQGLQFGAAAVFIAAGILIRVTSADGS